MDCVYIAADGQFEAPLLYALMNQMVERIPEISGDLKNAYQLEGHFQVPDHQH